MKSKTLLVVSFVLLAGVFASTAVRADDICKLLCAIQLGGNACNCSAAAFP